jgi:hypothetical protein
MREEILTKQDINLHIEELGSRDVEILNANIKERIDVLFTQYEQRKYLIGQTEQLNRLKNNFAALLIKDIDNLIKGVKNGK